MNDLDYKEESEEIDGATIKAKNSLITFLVSFPISVILSTIGVLDQSLGAIIIGSLASLVMAISEICFFVYKYKELKLLTLLSHKRLDEIVDKIESMNKN